MLTGSINTMLDSSCCFIIITEENITAQMVLFVMEEH